MTRDPTTGRFVSREWVKFQATKAHLTPYTLAGNRAANELGRFVKAPMPYPERAAFLRSVASIDAQYEMQLRINPHVAMAHRELERQRLIDEAVRASISEAASPPDRVHRYGTKYGATGVSAIKEILKGLLFGLGLGTALGTIYFCGFIAGTIAK